MKKILFISPFFYPEPISSGKYNSALVRELAEKAKVTVLCMHPFYPAWVVVESDAEMDGVDIHRVGKRVKFPNNSMFRRLVLEIYFGIVATFFTVFLQKKYDLIVNVLPPSFFAFFINLFFRKKAINIVHDLQYEYVKGKKGGLAWVLKRCIRFVETVVLRNSLVSYYLSETMRDQALDDFGLDSANSSIAYPFITLQKRTQVDEAVAALFSKEGLNVVYSGALGEKQNGYDLIPHMVRYGESHAGVNFHVFSQGPIFDHLKRKYGHSGHVSFHDLVPEESLWSLCAMSDLSIIPQASGTSKGSLPSKLPNLVYTKVPVLCVTDQGSELSEIIDDLKSGESIFSWDYEAFHAGIELCLRKLNQYYPPGVDARIDELFSISSFSDKIVSEN